MDKSTGKTLRIVSCIFFVIGVGLLVGSIIARVSGIRFMESADKVTATIKYIDSYRTSNGSTGYRVYVDYIYNGQSYQDIRLNMYSSSMYEGKEITIFCDRENPKKIRGKFEDMFLFLVLGIMGIVFILTAGLVMRSMVRDSKRRKKMLSTAKQLYATVEKIEINTGYKVNGNNPYLIYCTYKDEYKDVIYRFKSDNIWMDPNLILKPGDIIRVFVNPEDYSKYYVDTKSLFEEKVIDYT